MSDKKRLKRQRRFEKWLQSNLANQFLQAESTALAPIYKKMKSQHVVIIGSGKFSGVLADCGIQSRILIEPQASHTPFTQPVISKQDKLPILSDSVESVYLAHCLEWADNPHEILREANRIMMPEGDLVITGFNPWSLWGVVYQLLRLGYKPAWAGQLHSMAKLKDWLGLLGLDLLFCSTFFYGPPIYRKKWTAFEKCEPLLEKFLPNYGSGVVLHAKKRLIPLTPIKPKVLVQQDFLPHGIVDSGIE